MRISLYIAFLLLFIVSCNESTQPIRNPAVYGKVTNSDGNVITDADICVIPVIHSGISIAKSRDADQFLNIDEMELSFFRCEVIEQNILIAWETLSELNIKHFQVYKASKIGDVVSEFILFETVESKGNSANSQIYTLFDEDVEIGKKYLYKLKVVNLDNSESFTNEVEIELKVYKTELQNIFPSPFTNYLNIPYLAIDEETIRVKFIEKLTGNVYYTNESNNAGQYVLNVSTIDDISGRILRPGIYRVEMEHRDSVYNMEAVLHFPFDITNGDIPIETTKSNSKGEFIIEYDKLPDYQEVRRTSINGELLNTFMYGDAVDIVTRKIISESSTSIIYEISQNRVIIDKNVVVDLECKTHRLTVNK